MWNTYLWASWRSSMYLMSVVCWFLSGHCGRNVTVGVGKDFWDHRWAHWSYTSCDVWIRHLLFETSGRQRKYVFEGREHAANSQSDQLNANVHLGLVNVTVQGENSDKSIVWFMYYRYVIIWFFRRRWGNLRIFIESNRQPCKHGVIPYSAGGVDGTVHLAPLSGNFDRH